MKPHVLTMDSEALADFREKLDQCLALLVCRMKERKLTEGTLTGKLKVTISEAPDMLGQLHTMMELEPEVSVNMSAKGKVECEKQAGMFMQLDEDGRPVIGSCQVDIEELLEEMAQGEE